MNLLKHDAIARPSLSFNFKEITKCEIETKNLNILQHFKFQRLKLKNSKVRILVRNLDG